METLLVGNSAVEQQVGERPSADNAVVEQQEVEQPSAANSAAERVEQPSADRSAAAQVGGVALVDNSAVAEQTKVEQPFVGRCAAAELVERKLTFAVMQLMFVQATGTVAGTIAVSVPT